jgi:hypothetical protein
LIGSLTRFLNYFYEVLNDENGPREIGKEWQRRSSYFSGKSVRIVLEDETVTELRMASKPTGRCVCERMTVIS